MPFQTMIKAVTDMMITESCMTGMIEICMTETVGTGESGGIRHEPVIPQQCAGYHTYHLVFTWALVTYIVAIFTTDQDYHISHRTGQDRSQIGQIIDFVRYVYSTLCLTDVLKTY